MNSGELVVTEAPRLACGYSVYLIDPEVKEFLLSKLKTIAK